MIISLEFVYFCNTNSNHFAHIEQICYKGTAFPECMQCLYVNFLCFLQNTIDDWGTTRPSVVIAAGDADALVRGIFAIYYCVGDDISGDANALVRGEIGCLSSAVGLSPTI